VGGQAKNQSPDLSSANTAVSRPARSALCNWGSFAELIPTNDAMDFEAVGDANSPFSARLSTPSNISEKGDRATTAVSM
jgi:hypothetical protein